MSHLANLKIYAASILVNGPRRVLIEENFAVSPKKAKINFDITPDIVFIRNDGWSLGAPKHLANQAEQMWKRQWIGVMLRPCSQVFTMNEYQSFKKVISVEELNG